MVTLQDIAKRVGVTPTVVSYTLSNRLGKIRVSEARRAEILRVAAEMGYTGNRSARALVTRRNHAIGLLLHQTPSVKPTAGDFALLFNLLEGMRRVSDEAGYQTLYGGADLIHEGAFEPPLFLANRSVDAIALYGYLHPSTARQIAEMGLPLLHIGTNLAPEAGIANVSAGLEAALCAAMKAAAEAGLPSAHLYLPSGPGPEAIAKGLLAMAARDLPGFHATVALGEGVTLSYDEIFQHGRKLAAQAHPPALLFCSMSAYAPLVSGMKEAGRLCPEEIQLVTFAGEGYHTDCLMDRGLPISQIVLPFSEVGREIAGQFVGLLEGHRPSLEEAVISCHYSAGATAPALAQFSL